MNFLGQMDITGDSAYLLRRFLALVVLAAINSAVADEANHRLELYDLLSQALQKSPAIVAADADLLAAQYKIGEQRSVFWPQADLNIEYSDINEFNVVEDGAITGQRSRLRTDNITIRQSIYNAVQISQWQRSKLEYDYYVNQRLLIIENSLSDIMGLFIDFHLQKVSLELLQSKMRHLSKQRELLKLKGYVKISCCHVCST